jgi:hypothetical protein
MSQIQAMKARCAFLLKRRRQDTGCCAIPLDSTPCAFLHIQGIIAPFASQSGKIHPEEMKN